MHELFLCSTFLHGLEPRFIVYIHGNVVFGGRKSGRELTRRRINSYNANASFTLMLDRTHPAEKYAVARNTSAEPEGLRTIPPEPMNNNPLVPTWIGCRVLHRTMISRSYVRNI